MKKNEGPYVRDVRAVQECIELEHLPTGNPEGLAKVFVITHSWGQGDALAGVIIHRMLAVPENKKYFSEWFEKLCGHKPLMGTSPMTMLLILGELGKRTITFRHLDRCGSGSVVKAMEKAKTEILARQNGLSLSEGERSVLYKWRGKL